MSDNNDAENTLHYEYLQETLILRDCNPHYLKYRNFTQFPGAKTVPFQKIYTPGN